ncbi:MAG: VCBS repeat-containing protein [Planctomycetes bacterium]|nr:VCBS repeat-containing protein [Planctomycetota bacterium]
MHRRVLAALLSGGMLSAQSVLDLDVKIDLSPAETAAFSTGFQPLDFDRDGRLDLLVAGEYGYWYSRAALRRGLGDGRFEPVPASSYTGWFYVHALGDLDNDGRLEMAGDDGLSAIEPDGRIVALPASVGGGAAAFGDVDGDGDLDVVRGGARVEVFLQTAPLTFVPSTGLTGLWAWVVALGDVDGDGDLDVVAGRAHRSNGLYLNDGHGVFTDASVLLPGAVGDTVACVVRDLDGDGASDVLWLDRGGGATLLLQRAGSLVDASARLPVPAGDHVGLAVGDVDGDGYLDVAVASNPGGTLLRGTASGWFVAIPGAWPAARPNGGVALLDVDGDGDLDLLEAGWTSNDRVHFNEGHWRFRGPSAQPRRPTWSGDADDHWARLCDLDRDGDLDLLAPDTWWCNDGFGGFSARPSAAPAIQWATTIAVGDVDGDRALDVVAPAGFDRFRVHSGDSRGGFVAGPDHVAPIDPSSGYMLHQTIVVLALADLDADGDLDLLCGAAPTDVIQPAAPARDSLWWNDGTGHFVEDPGFCPTGEQFGKDVAFGDLDGDGRLDFTDGFGSFVQRPDHTFAYVAPDPSGWLYGGNLGAVALGDLDGDGALDAVEANACYGTPWCEGVPDVIAWNRGDGSLLRVPFTTDHETHDVALLDADADGDLDIFLARVDNGSHGIGPNELWLNEGGRSFQRATFGVEVPQIWRDSWVVEAGDVDGDGDTDLLTLDSAMVRGDPHVLVWTNLERQLRSPELLRPGRRFTLELHGVDVGGAVFGAPLLARVELPGIGVLGLHPDAATLFATFAGPRSGRRAELALTLPADPALAGAFYAFQAVVVTPGGGLRLTNRIVETIAGL